MRRPSRATWSARAWSTKNVPSGVEGVGGEAPGEGWRPPARAHPPALGGGDAAASAQAPRRMARINAAYELLSEPERREAWDLGRGVDRQRWAAPGGPARDADGPP